MANKGLRQARRERAKGVKEQGQENIAMMVMKKGRYDKKGDDIEYGKTPRYSKKIHLVEPMLVLVCKYNKVL